MNKSAILLLLLAGPAHAAEPPDWYAHIPAEQRAALLAARHAGPPHSLIGSGSPLWYGELVSAPYSAPQSPAHFDASALVGPLRYDLAYYNRQRAIVRSILWSYRQTDVHNSLTARGVWNGTDARVCGTKPGSSNN